MPYITLLQQNILTPAPLSVRSCLLTTATIEREYVNTAQIGDVFPSPQQLLHQSTWHGQFLEVRPSRLVPTELGVFSTRPIPKGTNLGYYSGMISLPYTPQKDSEVNDYLVGFNSTHNNLYRPMVIDGKTLTGHLTPLGVLARINEYIWCANPDRRKDLNNCGIVTGSPGLIRTTQRIAAGTELTLTLGLDYDWTTYLKHLAAATVTELIRYNNLFVCSWNQQLRNLRHEVSEADMTSGTGSDLSTIIFQHVSSKYNAALVKLPADLNRLKYNEWLTTLLNYRPLASATVFRHAHKPGIKPTPQPLQTSLELIDIPDDIRHQLRPYQEGEDPRTYWTNDNLISYLLNHVGQNLRKHTTLALPGFAESITSYPNGANTSYLYVHHRTRSWLHSKWLLIPMLVRTNHWIFVSLHVPTLTAYVGDSLYYELQDVISKFLDHLSRVLQELANKRIRSWTVRRLLLPKQLNSFDCGVHVCHNLVAFVTGRRLGPLSSTSLRHRVLLSLSSLQNTRATKVPSSHSYWFRHYTSMCSPPQLRTEFVDLLTQTEDPIAPQQPETIDLSIESLDTESTLGMITNTTLCNPDLLDDQDLYWKEEKMEPPLASTTTREPNKQMRIIVDLTSQHEDSVNSASLKLINKPTSETKSKLTDLLPLNGSSKRLILIPTDLTPDQLLSDTKRQASRPSGTPQRPAPSPSNAQVSSDPKLQTLLPGGKLKHSESQPPNVGSLNRLILNPIDSTDQFRSDPKHQTSMPGGKLKYSELQPSNVGASKRLILNPIDLTDQVRSDPKLQTSVPGGKLKYSESQPSNAGASKRSILNPIDLTYQFRSDPKLHLMPGGKLKYSELQPSNVGASKRLILNPIDLTDQFRNDHKSQALRPGGNIKHTDLSTSDDPLKLHTLTDNSTEPNTLCNPTLAYEAYPQSLSDPKLQTLRSSGNSKYPDLNLNAATSKKLILTPLQLTEHIEPTLQAPTTDCHESHAASLTQPKLAHHPQMEWNVGKEKPNPRFEFTPMHLASLKSFCTHPPPPQVDNINSTRVATLNIRRLTRDKILSVVWYIHQYDIDVLFLIDTQVRPNEKRLYTQYFKALLPTDTIIHSPLHPSSYTAPVGHHTGGICCIIADKCARHMASPKLDSLQLGIGLNITLTEHRCKLHLCAVYWPSAGASGPHQLRTRMNAILAERGHHTTPDDYLKDMMLNWMGAAKGTKYLICGDFNCEWTSSRLSWMRDISIRNLAECTDPTFFRSATSTQTPSRIDHIVGCNITPLRSNVCKDESWAHDTDHRPLMIEFACTWTTPAPLTILRHISTTKFPSDLHLIEQYQATLLELPEADDSYKDLHNIMAKSVNTSQLLTHTGKPTRARHYDGWSPSYACLRLKHDYLVRIRRLVIRNKLRLRYFGTTPQAERLVRQWRTARDAYQPTPDCVKEDPRSPEYWLYQTGHYILKAVPLELTSTLKQMHGRQRALLRRDINDRIKAMEEARTQGKPGSVLRALCGPSKASFDLDSVGTPNNGTLHQPHDIHNALTDAMAELYQRQGTAPLSNLPLDISLWNETDFANILGPLLPSKIEWTIPILWKGFTALHRGPNLQRHHNLCEFTTKQLSQPPTFAAFDDKLSRTKAKTAPGISGLSYQMMKAWPTDIRRRVHSALVHLWNTDITPPMWDHRLLVLIPKGDGPLTTSTMRPLTLLEPLRKMWVGLMCKPLYKEWDRGGYLSPMQWGYRSQRDTSLPTTAIHAALEYSRTHSTSCTLSSFDIKKAFDSVSLHMLQLSYTRMGVPLSFAQRLLNLETMGRTIVRTPHATHMIAKHGLNKISLQSNNKRKLRYFVPERGMGQGDVPSAPLWNAFFDTLAKSIEALVEERPNILSYCRGSKGLVPIRGSIYADDYVQLCSSSDNLQLIADIVSAWAITVGATIAPDKIRTLATPTQRGHPLTITTNTSSTTVALAPAATTCPYLGVQYTSTGSTASHFQSLRAKLQIMIGRVNLRVRSYTATSIALAIALKVNTKAAYVIARSPFTLSQLQQLQTPLNVILRKCTLNGQGFPTHLLYLPSQLGGLGLPSLVDSGIKQKLAILTRGLFDGGYSGSVMDAILTQELERTVVPTCGYRYPIYAPHHNKCKHNDPNCTQYESSCTHYDPSWLAALTQYAAEAGCYLWRGGLDTHRTSEMALHSLDMHPTELLRAQHLGITTVSDLLVDNSLVDLSALHLQDLQNLPDPATLQISGKFKTYQCWIPVRAPHLLHELIAVTDDKLLIHLWCKLDESDINQHDQLVLHHRTKCGPLVIKPSLLGAAHRAYITKTDRAGRRQVKLLHGAAYIHRQGTLHSRDPTWMINARQEIQNFLAKRPPGVDFSIVTDGSWKLKTNDPYDLVTTHPSNLRADSKGSIVVIYWNGTQYLYKAFCCVLQHHTRSAFEVELYMVCLAGLLCTECIHTDCKSVIQTISDPVSTRKRLTSRVGQLLGLANKLHLGGRLQHCPAHPERSTPLAAWTQLQHGIYLADHYASVLPANTSLLKNRDIISGTHIPLPHNPVQEAIELTQGWYWGDVNGRVIFEDIIERYHIAQLSLYTKERDTYPRQPMDNRPRWVDCHPTFCATVHRFHTLALPQRAAIARLIWDKYNHGRVRGIHNLGTTNCIHCGNMDSRAHIILHCTHTATQEMRIRALDKCRDLLHHEDYSPQTIAIGRRLINLASTHTHGDYIWCGMLTNELVHLLFIAPIPSGPNFSRCQQLIIKVCSTLATAAHVMLRDSLDTYRHTVVLHHPRMNSHTITPYHIPRRKLPLEPMHNLYRRSLYRNPNHLALVRALPPAAPTSSSSCTSVKIMKAEEPADKSVV